MSKIKKPLIGIGGEFDGTPYQSSLYSRNGQTVTGPTMTDGKAYSDGIAYLNGYGSLTGHDLGAIMNSNKPTGFTSITCGIDSENRFFVEASHTFSHATTGTNPSASRELFGFSGSETVTGSGPFRLTASNMWRRGVFQLDQSKGGFKIDTGGSVSYTSIL